MNQFFFLDRKKIETKDRKGTEGICNACIPSAHFLGMNLSYDRNLLK